VSASVTRRSRRTRRVGGTGRRALPAALREATLFLDAYYSKTSEPRVVNQGSGGSALDAKYGSVLGAYVYQGAAVLPGIASNNLSVPDAANFNPTTSLDYRMSLKAADWTPSSIGYLAGKYGGAGSRSWTPYLNTDGRLYFVASPDGTATVATVTTAAIPGVVDDTTVLGIRFLWTPNLIKISVKTSAVAGAAADIASDAGWTELACNASGLSAASIFDNTSTLAIGQSAAGAGPAGTIYSALLKIDGTTVLDVDLANVPDYATSFTATTGQTVTVNSTSADTNDPLLLTHTGVNYAYMNTSNANRLTMTDAANLNPTTSLSLRCAVALDDWTPSAIERLMGKRLSTGNQRTFVLQINSTNGFPVLGLSTDGIVGGDIAATVAPVIADRSPLALRADWTASPAEVKFYTKTFTEGTAYADINSDDGWTQLGATVTASVPSVPLYDSTTALAFGATLDGGSNGKYWAWSVKVDGSLIAGINCATDITSSGATSFTATSGQEVTVTRALSGRKTVLVTRPVWLFGTDDYLEIADNALLDFGAAESFTAIIVARKWATNPNSVALLSKRADYYTVGDVGWALVSDSTNAYATLGDGVTQATKGTTLPASGTVFCVAQVVDRSGNTVLASMNGVPSTTQTTATIGTLANSLPLRVGRTAASSGYNDMEVLAVAVFRRALSATEIAQICTYYGTA